MSYHFNYIDEFHLDNIGIEDLVKYYHVQDVRDESEFLHQCPIKLTNKKTIIIDKNSKLTPAQQLLANDQTSFTQVYQNFFVELVCESYFSGKTFFPTEKTFRPIVLKTPFIIQGPQYFLHNLKALGFKTFDEYWDEGYAEDPHQYQLQEITKILKNLSRLDSCELEHMYQSMQHILEHNYNRFFELTLKDFQTVKWKL
jgi:hypothetical protein